MKILLQRFAAVWLAVTVTFFALRLTANDAVTAQLTVIGADPAVIEQRKQEYGLDQGLLIQYSQYLIELFHGNLGVSLTRQIPVMFILQEAVGATIALAVPALILASLTGILIGILATSSFWLAALPRLWIVLSVSVLAYWSGTLIILLFSVTLHWFPSSGSGEVRQLVLPVSVLVFHTSGAIARVVQGSIRQTVYADFVRTARAKGLPPSVILIRHILRVSLLPAVTVIGLQSGFILGGTVITEVLFVRPGLGRVLLDATLRRDYPVVQGIVLLSAITYALINTVTDVIAIRVDPRIRISAE